MHGKYLLCMFLLNYNTDFKYLELSDSKNLPTMKVARITINWRDLKKKNP
jgi:hypothetical protein